MNYFTVICTAAIVTVACTATKPVVPGDAQLNAIKSKYPGVTMDKLKEGYGIFTGPCTKCHKPKNLYKRSEEELPGIIDRMAKKAKINDEQKDAVLKYVLSVKSAGPHSSK